MHCIFYGRYSCLLCVTLVLEVGLQLLSLNIAKILKFWNNVFSIKYCLIIFRHSFVLKLSVQYYSIITVLFLNMCMMQFYWLLSTVNIIHLWLYEKWNDCIVLFVNYTFRNWQLLKTLFKQVDGMPDADDIDCRMTSPRYLSLWLGLQHIGHDGVAARIQHSVNLVVNDYELLFLFVHTFNNYHSDKAGRVMFLFVPSVRHSFCLWAA